MKTISEEQIEHICLLRDKAENYLSFAKIPLPTHILVDGLAGGMFEIHQELKTICEELTK